MSESVAHTAVGELPSPIVDQTLIEAQAATRIGKTVGTQRTPEPLSASLDPTMSPAEGDWQWLRRSQPEYVAPRDNGAVRQQLLARSEHAQPFTFTGQAGEYFRVWIVNTFLMLVTIGLWSPWAKIRKRQFFLRHTWVAGANFDFHARPWPILRGRLIAGTLFVTYWFTGNLNPKYAAWVALVVALLAPWFIVNSLRFNLANTSYRNLRFGFDGRLIDGVRALLPLIIVAILTLIFPPTLAVYQFSWSGLKMLVPTIALLALYPYIVGAYRLMLLNKARYGAAPFECSARVRTIYAIYLRALLLAVCLLVAIAVIIGAAVSFLTPGTGDPASGVSTWMWWLTTFITFVFTFFALTVLYAYVQSRVVNLTLNLSNISPNVQIVSALRMRTLCRTFLVNALAIVASCGLAIPWAVVRVARLRVEATRLAIGDEIEHFAANSNQTTGAAADAASEFFSLDIAL